MFIKLILARFNTYEISVYKINTYEINACKINIQKLVGKKYLRACKINEN